MPYIDMQKILDTNPSGKEEALAMVVNSIAFEEANLAELIDTQSKELEFISEMPGNDSHGVGFVADINQSINSILERVIQLHIDEQLMLETIDKLYAPKHPPTGSPGNSAIMIDATAALPDMPAEPDNILEHISEAKDRISKTFAAKQNSMCILKGRGVGTVRNESDYFYEGISIIQLFVCSKPRNIMDNCLCYSVHNSTGMLIMIAFPDSLKIECRLYGLKEMVIKGEGKIIWKERCRPDVIDTGVFNLNVVYDGKAADNFSFEMDLKSYGNASFDHRSGKIELESGRLEMEDGFL